MDEADVDAYVERSQSLIEQTPQMDEQNTKVKLIQPLLELLGWDIYSADVELEYPMQIGRGNTRADYALQLENAPVVFIEAKGCDNSLSEGDRGQLTSYMRQKGVDWGLLTNGARFELFRRRQDSSRPDEVSLAQFSLEELSENWSTLKLLSKELVETGEAETIAHRIEARRHAVQRLQGEKERIAEEVTEVVVDEIGESLAQEVEPESKEFIDKLIASFEEKENDSKPLVADDQSEPTDKQSTDESGEESFIVTLYENGDVVQSFTGESQSNVMASAVDLLIRDYTLDEKLESIPYVPGKKNAILNTEPVHASGDQMRLYRELSTGYYLFVSLNQEAKKRHLRHFTDCCVLTTEFSGDW